MGQGMLNSPVRRSREALTAGDCFEYTGATSGGHYLCFLPANLVPPLYLFAPQLAVKLSILTPQLAVKLSNLAPPQVVPQHLLAHQETSLCLLKPHQLVALHMLAHRMGGFCLLAPSSP